MESIFKPVTKKIEDLLEDQLRQVRQTSESYINVSRSAKSRIKTAN
jgi:hypothetical protein